MERGSEELSNSADALARGNLSRAWAEAAGKGPAACTTAALRVELVAAKPVPIAFDQQRSTTGAVGRLTCRIMCITGIYMLYSR